MNFNSKKSGYTVLELVVVLGMVAILFAIVLVNYRSGSNQLALQRAAYKILGDVRRTQSMAGVDSGCGSYNYGLNFDNGATEYKLFADCNNNKAYTSGGSELKETIKMEKGVKVCEITGSAVSGKVDLVFVPPDPFVLIDGNRDGGPLSVKICLESDSSKSKTITITKAGTVSIQ